MKPDSQLKVSKCTRTKVWVAARNQEIFVSDRDGMITASLPIHLGDPNTEITLKVSGYAPCSITLPSNWSFRLEAELILTDRMQLRGTGTLITTSIEYDQNENGELTYNEDSQEFTGCTSA
jgi:hypothetical protein